MVMISLNRMSHTAAPEASPATRRSDEQKRLVKGKKKRPHDATLAPCTDRTPMIRWCYDLYILIVLSVIIDYTTALLQTFCVNKSIHSFFFRLPQRLSFALVHASVQVDEDVDGGDDNFGGDENDDDPFEIFAC